MRPTVLRLVVACCRSWRRAALCRRRTRPRSASWPSERPPRPLPARDVKFPPYEIQTLPNGLQVVVVLHHEQPAVSMRLLVRAGSASDPQDKLGLAHLAASLLDQGTTTMSAQEMNDAIDFIGGAMGAGAGTDLTFVNMVVMKDSFDDRPAHAVRHGAASGVRAGRDRAAAAADAVGPAGQPRGSRASSPNAVFDRLVYGFHPYGMPETGTPETLAAHHARRSASRSTRGTSRRTTRSSRSSAT